MQPGRRPPAAGLFRNLRHGDGAWGTGLADDFAKERAESARQRFILLPLRHLVFAGRAAGVVFTASSVPDLFLCRVRRGIDHFGFLVRTHRQETGFTLAPELLTILGV